MQDEHPIRVAVVGGGCAAMAAAFELTRPEHQGKYAVTIYQLGFRLGGKGASGRGAGGRIEEHGLHLWMGFYENAFRLMRECYAEAARDPARCRIADWRDAFKPDPCNAVADRSPSGAWLPWLVNFPALPGLPGDPPEALKPWTIADYTARSLILLRTLLQAIQLRAEGSAANGGGDGAARPGADSPPKAADGRALLEQMARLLRLGQLAGFSAVLEGLQLIELALRLVPGAANGPPLEMTLRLHELLTRSVRGWLEGLVARDDEVRRLWEIVDLTLAVVRGVLRFQLLTDPRGFDAIDDYDCREWLRLNGASPRAINSAFVRALYDLAFAYEDGDVRRPRIAAGQALRGAVRAFFTYRGAFFWKMQAGMGDVVFAPFWEVLSRRGVRFEFFHRLQNLRIADGAPGERPYVSALEFAVQARTRDGREYQPLIDVDGLPCWPAEPDYAQLVDGERLRAEGWDFEASAEQRRAGDEILHNGEHFDCVVLAVGVGEVPQVCREILARDARFRAMVERVKSVPTQALQLWLNRSTAQLGWRHGPTNLSGFVEPFDTWADMSHLIREERYGEGARSLAYFCSVLADQPAAVGGRTAGVLPDRSAADSGRRDEVKANALRFLERDLHQLWPEARSADGSFRWELLCEHGPLGSTGRARFDAQYWRANVEPTERYALSLPGSLRHRISPLDRSYDNLTLAGDYTDCGFNEGCVEAAVMSGRLAAHAIARSPALEDITGYDHP
jgi:uncharacterized protein with NAD-binding domain and iron-sulfur cluster